MQTNYLSKAALVLLLALFGLAGANAQPLANAKKVDIVQISTWMTPNNAKLEGAKPYVAFNGEAVVYETDAESDNTKWYEIPAGSGILGQQVYYYKNVATGVYLQGSLRTPGEGGDWTVSVATASATNDHGNLFKWSKAESNWGNGPWLVNEEGNTGARPSGENPNAFFALTMLTANSEFFGVDVPNVAVSNPHDGGNAWTAVEIKVVEAGADNPDYRAENAKTVKVIQITTWMTPNNAKLEKKQPYVASNEEGIVYETDAESDNTKWYEIPAGSGAFGQQVYYYKNVATGVYLQGSLRTPGEGGDWTVSAATASATNDYSNLFKWSKAESNWGNGPWLVNEEGNTGARPSGESPNAFFALTMLTANSEFFGVDVPNVAVSNPHDGGNAWTAVEIKEVGEDVDNPDYRLENTPTVDVIQITTWMTPNNAKLEQKQPYVASNDEGIVYETDSESDNTKWYEIPAGSGAFGQQVYYYKNVATGVYLQGSLRTPGEGGDWTVSAATASATNGYSNLFKWSKAESNWGNGPWLVNEEGNTGTRPSGENPNAFFALTMLTANSEFFGVDVPNVAVSNPHDGGNAWTAVKIDVVGTAVDNPDYDGTGEGITYNIRELNFFAHDGGEDPNASSYNAETHTITYNDAWRRAGWNFGPQGGLDASKHEQVYLEFDATALAGEDGNPEDIKLQFDVEYMDGSKETNSGGGYENGNEYRANVTEAWWNLTHAKTQKIKLITLKSEKAGDIVLKDARFREIPGSVDLIVTDVRWEPLNPKKGEKVLFFATIKNIGTKKSPEGVKHGVVFQVNTSTVSWCDGFFGPLDVDEEVEVSSRMEGSTGGLWTCGVAATYNIRAWVNDTNDVNESDKSNNYSDTKLLSTSTGMEDVIAGKGIVTYAGGALHVINYPVSATLSVYNSLGQTVSSYDKISEVMDATLSSGIYLIKVQYEGKSFVHKLIVK